ncbi:MAG: strawberry notch family protein, partial [Thermoplasmata archaeon]
GDSAGVGKGREIAAIMWDNWNRGRKKAIWLSEKDALLKDAQRDFNQVGWSSNKLFNHSSTPATRKDNQGNKISARIHTDEGVLFTTYSKLGAPRTADDLTTRYDQIVEWAGKDFDGVIAFDECVPSGTLISTPNGPKKIETLKKGDLVFGVDHNNGNIVSVSIQRTFKRKNTKELYQIGSLKMTGNHPIYTENRGYVPVKGLCVTDIMCYSPSINNNEGEFYGKDLRMVQGQLPCQKERAAILREVLFGEIPNDSSRQKTSERENDGRPVGKDRQCGQGQIKQDKTNRCLPKEFKEISLFKSESNIERRGQEEGLGCNEKERIQTSGRWEWYGSDIIAEIVGTCSWLANGACGWSKADQKRVSEKFQNRYSESKNENSNRGGWFKPPNQKGNDCRSEKNRLFGIKRMEGHQISKQGGIERFEHCSSEDIFVYNIETPTANYFANGLLVHNCHNMGNAVDSTGGRYTKRASRQALAGVALQLRLPKARVVYTSATGATTVMNLAYAERLGLWGEGTAFADKRDFIQKISSGGIAAME